MKKYDLADRVVVVTGGARGIGLATAKACASAGMRVALCDVDAEASAQAAASVGGNAFARGVDVTDSAAFSAFLDEVARELGPVDVLVNNAGIHHAGAYVDENPVVTQRLLAVNLAAVMETSRLALQRFLPRGSGHLVNVASAGGLIAVPRQTTYSTTKHAVVGFTRSLRQELHGTGVRTTLVCPGHITTDMTADFARLPLVRPLQPEQIATGIVGALRDGTEEVILPREMVLATRLLDVMPARLSDALTRQAGIHRLVPGS